MTIKEFHAKFIIKEKRMSFLYEKYESILRKQLFEWINNIEMQEKIMKESINSFCEKIAEYDINTDCYTAIVDCMREEVMRTLEKGNIPKENCCQLLQTWIENGTQIKKIPEKQMNLVLSDFSRKMFDYYIERYYYMKNIPMDSKLERKIAKIFKGNGSVTSGFVMHGYKGLKCSTESYIVYARSISAHFLNQIGSKKAMESHIDAMLYIGERIEISSAKRLFPFVVAILLIIWILSRLSFYGIIPW